MEITLTGRLTIFLIALLIVASLSITSNYQTYVNTSPQPTASTTPVQESYPSVTLTTDNQILVDGSKIYIVWLNVTHSTYAEGDALITVYDMSAGKVLKTIVVDDSDLVTGVYGALGNNAIMVAVTKYVSGRYWDLYVYLYNITEDRVYGPFPISETPYYEEYPLVAYNKDTDTFAVAIYLSGTTTVPLPVTVYNVTLLKFVNNQVALNKTFGYTAVGGAISYTTASHLLAPYKNGFVYLWITLDTTTTPANRDIAGAYIDSGVLADTQISTVVTSGENESLGEVFFYYNLNLNRSSAAYRHYNYIVVGDSLLVPVYVYMSGLNEVRLLRITPDFKITYIPVDKGMQPYLARGSTTFAIAYIKAGTWSPVVKIYDAGTFEPRFDVDLSLGGGSLGLPNQTYPHLAYTGAYYVAVWGAGNWGVRINTSLYAYLFDEYGVGPFVTSPIIPSQPINPSGPSCNVTPAGVRIYGSYVHVVYRKMDNTTPAYSIGVYRTTYGLTGELRTIPAVARLFDQLNDDYGAGNLKYPTNPVFVPGVFDLKHFFVYRNGSNTVFLIGFRELGGNPWGGQNGFSLQYVHLYLQTTLADLPLNYSTYGLNIAIGNGWHYSLLVPPGFNQEPVPGGEGAALYDSSGNLVAGPGEIIVRMAPLNNTIIIEIPSSKLKDYANIGKWLASVAVAGYDGYGTMRVRDVVSGDPQEWRFGGGDERAINAGVQPKVVDLLLPRGKQEAYLSSYKTDPPMLATVFMVNISNGQVVEVQVYPTETPTTTTTTETTTSPTETTPTTTSPTETTTTSPTETATTTETSPVLTTTVTTTVTETTTVTSTETTTVTETSTSVSTTTATTTYTVTSTYISTTTEVQYSTVTETVTSTTTTTFTTTSPQVVTETPAWAYVVMGVLAILAIGSFLLRRK